MLKVKILYKSKPFYGAGQLLGFKGAGLGINLKYVDKYDGFEFIVKDKEWTYYIPNERAKQVGKIHFKVLVVPFLECVAWRKISKVEELQQKYGFYASQNN